MGADLAALMGVRVLGFAKPDKLAIVLGSDVDDATARLAALEQAGLVSETKAGMKLTADAPKELERLILAEGARTSDDFNACYERFKTIDPLVKRASVTSQDDFDAGVDQLLGLHDKAKGCVRKMSRCVLRYQPYRDRLDAAIARIIEGDKASFTGSRFPPDSYHQAWWELHTDLVTTLGVEKDT